MEKEEGEKEEIMKRLEEMMSTPEGMKKLGNAVNPIVFPGFGYTLTKFGVDDPVPDICLTCKNWIVYHDRYPFWYFCGAGVGQIYCSEIQESGSCDEYENKEEGK